MGHRAWQHRKHFLLEEITVRSTCVDSTPPITIPNNKMQLVFSSLKPFASRVENTNYLIHMISNVRRKKNMGLNMFGQWIQVLLVT